MSASIRSGGEIPQHGGTDQAALTLAKVGTTPRWVKVGNNLLYTAFQAAALTKSQTLFSLPGGYAIHATKVKTSTAFAGTSITNVGLEIGIAGTVAKYGASFEAVSVVSDTNFGINFLGGTEKHAAATNILLLATAQGANLSALSAGAVDIWALVSKIDG